MSTLLPGSLSVPTTTVDTDYGCGVIRKFGEPPQHHDNSTSIARYHMELLKNWRIQREDPVAAYSFLQEHKRTLLNLISAEEFLARESLGTNSN